MSNRLPNVPPWVTGPAHDYLVSLVDAMDRELSQRRELQDGILYVAEEKPLYIIGANGVRYELTVDASGELTITPAPQQSYVVGAGALQAAMATLAGGDGSIAGGFIVGSNANGDWIEFAGKFAIAWRKVTPDWTSSSFQTWTTPITFSSVPGQFISMATHTGGGVGNAALDVIEDVANSPGADNFKFAFRGATDGTAAGEEVTIIAVGPIA